MFAYIKISVQSNSFAMHKILLWSDRYEWNYKQLFFSVEFEQTADDFRHNEAHCKDWSLLLMRSFLHFLGAGSMIWLLLQWNNYLLTGLPKYTISLMPYAYWGLVMHVCICELRITASGASSVPSHYIDGLVQSCSNSSALAMELLQSCTKPSICISAHSF